MNSKRQYLKSWRLTLLLLVAVSISCSSAIKKEDIKRAKDLGKLDEGWYINDTYKLRLPTVQALRRLKDAKLITTNVMGADKISEHTYKVAENKDGLLYTFGFQFAKLEIVDTAFSVDLYNAKITEQMARTYIKESVQKYFTSITKGTLKSVPVAALSIWDEKQPVYFCILRLPLKDDFLNYYVAVMPFENLLIATSGQFLDSKIKEISPKQKDGNSLALYLSVALWENGENYKAIN